MHSYLRAIGFSNLKKGSEIEKLLEKVFRESEDRRSARQNQDSSFMEYSKSF